MVLATLLTSLLVLAGCATNGTQQAGLSAESEARLLFLARTQSDPLGAYLRNVEYPQSKPAAKPQGNQALASTALTFLGTKYRFGGDAPGTGFDCSGLVSYAAEQSLGLKLPRSSRDIARLGTSVKRDELKLGDLVFFNTRGHRNSHVGIYVGNQRFVHAPRSGSVVRVERMDIAYWSKRYNGARRLSPAQSGELDLASLAGR